MESRHQYPRYRLLAVCVFLTLASARAQDSLPEKPERVRKITTLERYDQSLVIPHAERLDMKREWQQEIARRRAILDTMDLPRRRKLKLLRELYQKPSGDLWAQLLESPEDPLP